MKQNSICIIALDALEYDLVKEFNLEGLMQEEWGRIDVTMFQDLSTPIVWASFITGLPPERHGLRLKPYSKPRELLHACLRLIPEIIPEKLRHNFPLQTRRRFFKTELVRRRKKQGEIYEDIREQFRSKNLTTLFDNIHNSIAISISPYQQWIKPATMRLMKETLERKVPFVIFEEHVRSIFLKKKRKLLDAIKRGGWRLLMVHFMFTDLLAHFKINNKQKMLEIYSEAESLVEEVKDILEEETVLLIVSDHGMQFNEELKFGEHTSHGFYSCNRKLGLANPKITYFYSWVEKQCAQLA